jgi:1-deoxyxylulose-5-phosphate synthase
MKYRQLGRTGLEVSRLCLGLATVGGQADEKESFAMLDRAATAGINFLDVADIYPASDQFKLVGRSEEIVGRWLKGKRDQFILTTKAGMPMGPLAWNRGNSRKHLLDAVEGSLRRLDTDYVDLYLLHADDTKTPLDESVEALDVIVRTGKTRYVGVSNFLAYRLARALGRADLLRVARFVVVQPRYNLLFRQPERELLALAQEEGLAVTPYNPLAGGLLTGRYQLEETPGTGRFSGELGNFGAMYRERYWRRQEFATVTKLSRIAEENGRSLITLSVAWLLAHPAVTSVILGASRAAQLDATLAAVDLELDADLKTKLDEVTAEYRRGDADR